MKGLKIKNIFLFSFLREVQLEIISRCSLNPRSILISPFNLNFFSRKLNYFNFINHMVQLLSASALFQALGEIQRHRTYRTWSLSRRRWKFSWKDRQCTSKVQ